jgi:N utilization substance protein B
MLFRPEVPAKVAINEALELAKRYSTAQSSRFVNGILDRVLQCQMQEANPESNLERSQEPTPPFEVELPPHEPPLDETGSA